MKPINKVLISFLVLTSVSIFIAWKFIHSEKFSKDISQRASKLLTKEVGAELSFKRVEFGLFPPSTKFKDVKLDKKNTNGFGAEIKLEELGVYFTYGSLFSSKLEIDELELKNGILNVEIDEDPNMPDINWKKVNTLDAFNKYANIYSKMPIHFNILKLNNVETQINDIVFSAKYISLSPQKKDARLKVEINNIESLSDEISLDNISGIVKVEKDVWTISKLNIKDDKNIFTIDGLITSPKQVLETKINGEYSIDINTIANYVQNLSPEIAKVKGIAFGDFLASGNLFDPNLNLNMNIKSLKSNWINLESITANINKKKNIISLHDFKATNQKEIYSGHNIGPIFDISKLIFLNTKAKVDLVKANTNTFLYTIRESLDVFKGLVSGSIIINWDGKNIKFEITNKTILENFELKLSGKDENILKNKGFVFDSGIITLETDMSVALDLKLKMQNSYINARGTIKKDGVDINIVDSVIDLNVLGPISGVKLEGIGPVDMKIHGPYTDVAFDLDINWKNFSVVDLHFGEIKTKIKLTLNDLNLEINNLVGQFNQSNYTANGKLIFGNKSSIDLNLDFKETNFTDARNMYALAFKNIKSLPVIEMKFESKYHITGGFNLDELIIEGKIKGSELKIFEEEADFVNLDFSLNQQILKFENIEISKSRGQAKGNFYINLKNNHMELAGFGKGLKLSDFNHYQKTGLTYDGDLNLDFEGSGNSDKFPSRIKIKTTNAFIDNNIASGSTALIEFKNNDIITKLDLFGSKVKSDIIIGMESKQVSIKNSIDTNDIRELLGVFSAHNIIDKTISGKIKAKVQTDFNLVTNKLSKLLINISSFNLKKGDVDLRNVPGKNIISIQDGVVEKWDLRFVDGEDFFNSLGENLPNGAILLSQNFSIKASIFQLLSSYIDRANGKMKGNYQVSIGKEIKMNEFKLYAKNNSLKFKKMPGQITDLEYEVIKDKNNFIIKKILGKYGEGEFKIIGTILFDNFYPKINLDYKIERSTIPLFKRSSILISGLGNFAGIKPPYKLSGKFQILHGELLDDPSDYSGEKKVSLEEYKKYLPAKNKTDASNTIELNINFETASTPVLVKNNLAELYLKGAGQVFGSPADPEVNGRIDAIPTLSKFKFKGHDFIINQGYVELKDTGKVRNSDLKFVGISKINDYDMKIDLSGKIDKLNINLSSEPALAQEDLLSLLTLGVTSDMSKNLEAGERKFVTTVGIGTLLVDQLKINDDLNSSLGLKLSVMPEFREEVTSLVQGKSAVADSSSSRLKSSTKIKVNKQITKKIDVSLSSTVGGSLEQKQEVNVNYNFNKSLSLEGVYEVKPAEDTSTSTSTPNSVGADLKYRWSF